MVFIALIAPMLALGAAVARSQSPEVIGLALNSLPFAAPFLLASARTALGPFGPKGRPSTAEDYVRIFAATFLHALAAEIAAGIAFFTTCSATFLGVGLLSRPASGPNPWQRLFVAGVTVGAMAAVLVLMRMAAMFLRRYRTTTEDGTLSGRRE